MSKTYILGDVTKAQPNDSSKATVSLLRHDWRSVVHRILNNEFHNERRILQSTLRSTVFERSQRPLYNEYAIEESERTYAIESFRRLRLPGRGRFTSIVVRQESIVRTIFERHHEVTKLLVPSLVQPAFVMKISALEEPSERSRHRLLTQKRVTSKPTDRHRIFLPST